MAEQALLPLYPQLTALGTPAPTASPSRENNDVEYVPLAIGSVLNRCLNPRLPFRWTINPYRGCELACTYCYARYTHRFFELTRWQDFERRIFFKRRAASRLERELRRRDLRRQPIAIGTATDPYQPAEIHYRVTRSLLEVFASVESLELSITTKSPLILRDLDLLTTLDRVHSVTAQVTITTLDPGLARRIEQRAPSPQARLRTVRTLAAAGISTTVFCMPLMPGINNDEDSLAPLFAAARDAGADDVVASPLFLRPAARDRFLPWLRSEFPALEGLYRSLYGRQDYLPTVQRDRLMAHFRHLRLLYGFPRRRAARG
ncbi:MAG: radical SAM protein [Acidobacteriota bacterium]|nr:radical SAM protein [Acidobacteriota bacterium]